MIRSMEYQDISHLAELHLRRAGIGHHLLPMVESTYRALLQSPLAVVLVSTENDAITGYILATTDRQRLLSDLISRQPGRVLASLLTNPWGTRSLMRLLASPVKNVGTTAEILLIHGEPNETARELIQQAIAEISKRGAHALWTSLPESDTWNALFHELEFNRENQENGSAVLKRSLTPDPNYKPGPFTLRDRLRCAFRLEQMVVFPIYTLVLIPFASCLAMLGCKLDAYFGLPVVIPEPYNYVLMSALILFGGLFLVYSYSYLILEGEGGPVPPFSAKTRSLVTTGPYTYVRHPSILAKLVGVIGLGIGFNSWCFLGIIIPLLVCWSIFWNGTRQDTDLVTVFGDEYLEYQRNVPMLVPRIWRRRQ